MKKRSEIETIYASDVGITFLMEHYFEDEVYKDCDVVGFYYGEPNEQKTRDYFLTHNKE